MPVYNAELTRIRQSEGQSSGTDMSSMDRATTTHSHAESVANMSKTPAAGTAKKLSTGPKLVRAEKLLTPAAFLRQKQMNDFDRRASDAQRAIPSTSASIELSEIEAARGLVIARPKSQVPRTNSDSFAPVTFSTPVQAPRPRNSRLPTANSAGVRSSISPVQIEETPVTVSVPVSDAHMETNQPSTQPPVTPPRIVPSGTNAPKSSIKQSRIPQWARDSTRKAMLGSASTATAIRPPIPEIGTPKSSLVPSTHIVSDVNPSAGPPPIPAAVGKAPTPTADRPIVTFNLTVNNNRPAASPQITQAPPSNEANPNASPVNSNRVSSTITTNKPTTNEASADELLMTDDEDQTDAARQPQMWKAVANRHATPGIQLIDNRRSQHTEPNKSLRRQLFQPRKSNGNQSQLFDEQPEPMEMADDTGADADEGDIELVSTHRRCGSQTQNVYETHPIATEQSSMDRPMSETYNKERASLRNYTYDVVNSVDGTQPNASASHAVAPESSERPVEVANVIDSVHADAMTVDEAAGGSDSSAAASSTTSDFENIPQIVSIQSLHPNHTSAMSVVVNPVQHSSPLKTMKSPESTTADNQTPTRSIRRTVLAPLSRTNNHSVRMPSLSIATSTTNALRESETFSSVLPPANFQDDIIREHSPTVVRDSINQVGFDAHSSHQHLIKLHCLIFQIISSQKNKSPRPLSLSNRSRGRNRRKNKNKSKSKEAYESDNAIDTSERIAASQNGRRTLYTKGNSDCEDNDAVSNEASSTNNNQQPSTSHAAQCEMTQMRNQIAANNSNATSKNPIESTSFEKNSISASSTVKSSEPSMNTMLNDGGPSHLSDIIEEVPEITARQADEVVSKRKKKATKASTKAKAPTKRTAKETQAPANDDSTPVPEGVRRSNRARFQNPYAVCHGDVMSRYEVACRSAVSKRRPSPIRETEPESESRTTQSKKRRVGDKTSQVTKPPAESTVSAAAKSKSKTAPKKQRTTANDRAEPTTLYPKDYWDQVLKELNWFEKLCDSKTMPSLVSQEGVYKIHTNHLDSVKIGTYIMVTIDSVCESARF